MRWSEQADNEHLVLVTMFTRGFTSSISHIKLTLYTVIKWSSHSSIPLKLGSKLAASVTSQRGYF